MMHSDSIFCTIFDSNYLDKGLVLYDSMVKSIPEFKLYVFAFDKKCEEILRTENLKNMIVIGLQEFESEEMLRVKAERTKAEYCWTCSSLSIQYVLNNYKEPICTYIDADMMFFSNPQVIFDEMKKRQCSTIIVPHRFKTIEEEQKAHNEVGSYCVGFNTFLNDKNGREALDWWAERCLEWCFYAIPGTTEWYGDQKYLNVFTEKFNGVMVCDHYGVGIAPWNINLVEPCEYINGIPSVRVKKTKETFPIIVYHFERVGFLTKNLIHAHSGIKSDSFRKDVYGYYVSRIIEKRKYIKQTYNFEMPTAKRVVTNNPIMSIYHKYLSPIIHIKSMKDLYKVK